MKKIIIFSIVSLFVLSCGMSAQEEERLKAIEDSLHNIDRQSVIEDVNSYFDNEYNTTDKNEDEETIDEQ
ncbi:MAG: hypothetical protein ACOXZK_06390 [Bacteroidales bacterium]